MKTYFLFVLILICLVISPSCYSQKNTTGKHKSERKVTVSPNPFKDSTKISISGRFDLNTLKISIQKKSGQAVLEFNPGQLPIKLFKGNLDPGLYRIRCVDKYGRIPTKRMTILGNAPPEPE